MSSINWDDVRARRASLGGQIQYDHLGDTYRGEIAEIELNYHRALIKLSWVAIWYNGKWHLESGDISAVEAVREELLAQQKDGGYRFTAFIFRNAKLYPKSHKDNVLREGLEYIPLPPRPQAAY